MKIAVASHKQEEVGGHAGRCRRFWIYSAEGGRITGREEVSLAPGETFHDRSHGLPTALNGIQALIAASGGPGLVRKLEESGVAVVLTEEPQVERAVVRWLAGELPVLDPSTLQHGQFGHGHAHPHEGEC
jgi:predicted Fe-Mo cluster-binding NifX family protein